jgi:hypothetical protein
MKTTYIYTLSDPRTNEVRYVGKTNNPVQRRSAHGVLTREVKSKKKSWIKKLKSLGLKPVFEIIEEVEESEWKFWEKYWIEQFRVWGFRLTNHTSGGDGCVSGNNTSFKKGNIPWNKDKKQKKNCAVCNQVFSVSPSRYYTQKCCSNRCKYIYMKSNKLFKGTYEYGSIPWNKNKGGYRSKARRNVHQYSALTGEYISTWYTAIDASKSLNINSESIAACCRGKIKAAGGYAWSYVLLSHVDPITYEGKTNNRIKSKLK